MRSRPSVPNSSPCHPSTWHTLLSFFKRYHSSEDLLSVQPAFHLHPVTHPHRSSILHLKTISALDCERGQCVVERVSSGRLHVTLQHVTVSWLLHEWNTEPLYSIKCSVDNNDNISDFVVSWESCFFRVCWNNYLLQQRCKMNLCSSLRRSGSLLTAQRQASEMNWEKCESEWLAAYLRLLYC